MTEILRAILLEASVVATSFIPQHLRDRHFVIIGGTALVLYGSGIPTRDGDILCNNETVIAFHEAASRDPRFIYNPSDSTWEFLSTIGLTVPLEFVIAGGGFVSPLRSVRRFRGCILAGFGDLTVMKAQAFANRGTDHDHEGFQFALRKMRDVGDTFARWQGRRRLTRYEMHDIYAAARGTSLDTILEEVGL